jgi:prepilin-type N-terminal cleavage/methylation domain-containing protein
MKNIFRHKNQSGYSLVEVLVAITVLLIALVGPLTIAYSGLKRSVQSKDNTMAVFLAQEGIETIVKLREDAALGAAGYDDLSQVWDNVFDTLHSRCSDPSGCGVVISDDGSIAIGSVYECSGSNCQMKYDSAARVPYKQGGGVSGVDTAFTRVLQINVVDNSYAEVSSTVSWTGQMADSVTLQTYIYNTYYEP